MNEINVNDDSDNEEIDEDSSNDDYDYSDDGIEYETKNSEKLEKILFKIKELKPKLNKHKDMLEYPRFALSNHFSDLQNEVDLAFNQKLLEQSDETIKVEINRNYSEMIKYIQSFDTECLSKLNSKRVKQLTADEPKEKIEMIEKEFDALHQEIEIETNKCFDFEAKNTDYAVNDTHNVYIEKKIKDFESTVQKYEQITNDEILELNRKLFLNKTVTFFARRDDLIEDFIFKEMDNETTVGKLFITSIDVFNKEDIIRAYYDKRMK